MCQSSNTINWPLKNLTQHCLTAVWSQRSHCFCFWGFSHAHPVTVEGLCHTIQLTLHGQPWLGYEALCSLHIFVCVAGNVQMSVYKCAYLHFWTRRQDLCICFNLWFKTSCWRPRTQVDESWKGLRNSEQSKHKSKTSSGNYSRLKSHLLSL